MLTPPIVSRSMWRKRHEGTYLHSVNRLSVIEARLTMNQKGTPVWRAGPVIAPQSVLRLPKLSAYQEGRVSVGDRRSAEFERLLYDKARESLIDKFPPILRNLPCPQSHPINFDTELTASQVSPSSNRARGESFTTD